MGRHVITTNEIAEYCHVSHNAVLKWIMTGKMYAYRPHGDHFRIRSVDFIDFLNKYNFPIPRDFENMVYGKKKILIVDDDRTIVHTIKKVLSLQHKYDIKVAFDGESAKHIIKIFKPDLITLDIHMPEVNGYDVCRLVRSMVDMKRTQIMFITAYSDYDDSKFAFDLGADEFLSKPFYNNDLIRRVDTLLKVSS